jgi:acyl-CoA dehydrogenase
MVNHQLFTVHPPPLNFDSEDNFMVSFDLSSEQKLLREMARRFAQNEMAPVAGQYDERGEFATEVYDKAFTAGLMNDIIPEQYGGAGLSAFETALVAEELAAGCAGMATTTLGNGLATIPILNVGSEEQKERFLTMLTEKLAFASFDLTEPGAGSDAAAIATTATKKGDRYILNGEKCFITNGGVAEFHVVFATLDKSKRSKGITAFIVPSDTPGVSAGKDENKMGHRASNTTSVLFENVEIPHSFRLGEEGQGFKIALQTLDRARSSVAAIGVGVARAAMDHAVAYARERVAFGQPIAGHQGIEFMIAEMARDVEAARMLTWHAAWLFDQGKNASMESSCAKLFATDTAMRVATDAVQIFGGNGYMREYPVEKLMRDAKLLQIYEGTNQIQRIVIARNVIGT